MLLLLFACHRPPATTPDLVAAPDVVAPAETGHVTDGVYADGRYPMRVKVPSGWTAAPGMGEDPVRVTLVDPEGDVTVRVTAVPGDTPTPRAIAGCSWTFTDLARYRAIPRDQPILGATCTPDAPGGARVLAWIVAAGGVSWSVEGTVPPGRLAAGRADLDTVAAGLEI